MYEPLKEHIKAWNAIDGHKPRNEDVFVDGFIELCKTLDDERDVGFDGEGSYFGKQVTLRLGDVWGAGDGLIYFEIAYDQHEIRVYSGRHEGFWFPEYLSMRSDNARFGEVKTALFGLLYRVFGLPNHFDL